IRPAEERQDSRSMSTEPDRRRPREASMRPPPTAAGLEARRLPMDDVKRMAAGRARCATSPGPQAVAGGDLAAKIAVDVRGEFLDLKNTIDTLVGPVGSFA